VRLASINLWGLFGDWESRRMRLVEGWPRLAADVVVLQEARLHGTGDQAHDLQLLFDLPYAARDPRAAAGEEHEGVAVLSRRPLRHVEALPLPLAPPTGSGHQLPRIALLAELDVCGEWVPIVAAHTSVEPAEVLDAQLRHLAAVDGTRLVVAGDLNAEPEQVRAIAEPAGLEDALGFADMPTWPVDVQAFREAWTAALGAAPYFPVRPRRLDYVLTRGLCVEASGMSVCGDSARGYASDHAIVWADLTTPS
jgi:endonuclease/exonuclease/phosphatase family metal-dependent hydrolase